jgi:hypothetical protein
MCLSSQILQEAYIEGFSPGQTSQKAKPCLKNKQSKKY